MTSVERTRLAEAMDDLIEYRNQGEDIAELIDEVAQLHGVSADGLRAMAEKNWGAPIETDRERNPDHFKKADERRAKQERIDKLRPGVMKMARDRCGEVWENCCPDGEPDWRSCATKFFEDAGVTEVELRQEVAELFQRTGSDFDKARALYKRIWTQ